MKEHTHVAVDYLEELEHWTSHDYYDENVHKIQLPFTNVSTVKPVLSSHSKIDKTKILKTNGSLMKVESIAEFSLLTCIKR